MSHDENMCDSLIFQNIIQTEGIFDYLSLRDVINLCKDKIDLTKNKNYISKVKSKRVIENLCHIKIIINSPECLTLKTKNETIDDLGEAAVGVFLKLYGAYIKSIRFTNNVLKLQDVCDNQLNYNQYFDQFYLNILNCVELNCIIQNLADTTVDHKLLKISRSLTIIDVECLKFLLCPLIFCHLNQQEILNVFTAFSPTLLQNSKFANSFIRLHLKNYKHIFQTIRFIYAEVDLLTIELEFGLKIFLKNLNYFQSFFRAFKCYIKKIVYQDKNGCSEAEEFFLAYLLRDQCKFIDELQMYLFEKYSLFYEFPDLIENDNFNVKLDIIAVSDFQNCDQIHEMPSDTVCYTLHLASEKFYGITKTDFENILKLKTLNLLFLNASCISLKWIDSWDFIADLDFEPNDTILSNLTSLTFYGTSSDSDDSNDIFQFFESITLLASRTHYQLNYENRNAKRKVEVHNVRIMNVNATRSYFFQPNVLLLRDCSLDDGVEESSFLNGFKIIDEIECIRIHVTAHWSLFGDNIKILLFSESNNLCGDMLKDIVLKCPNLEVNMLANFFFLSKNNCKSYRFVRCVLVH